MSKYKFNWINIGNERALDFLDKSLEKGQIANSYIFSGPSDLGKFSLAKNFVENIYLQDKPELLKKSNFLETNSDYFVVEREADKKDISVSQIRDLIERLQSSSFLDSYRTVIIKDAENLNNNSSNALLKILEEANKKTVIILTVNNIDAISKTIASRSQIINLFPVKEDLIYSFLIKEKSLSPSLAKSISRLSMGKPMLAIKLSEDLDLYNNYQELIFDFLEFLPATFSQRVVIIDKILKKNELFDIFELWQSIIRDLILVNYGQYSLVKNEFAIQDLKDLALKYSSLLDLKRKSLLISTAQANHRLNIGLRSVLEYVAVSI